MGRFALKSDVRGKEFHDKYIISEGIEWRECENNKEPFDDMAIPVRTYSIYTSFFIQAGLKITFDPLLAIFLYKTRLHVDQLSPNTIRIILGIAKLNRRLSLNLDFHDIRYCYSLWASKKYKKWNLKARVQTPSLIEALPDSHKYMYKSPFLGNSAHLVCTCYNFVAIIYVVFLFLTEIITFTSFCK